MNLGSHPRLLLIADQEALGGRDWLDTCRAAVAGGVTAVQVRAKNAAPRELTEVVRRLVAGLAVPVMVNDRLDVALAAGAAGVHLGVDDLAVPAARGMSPDGFVIGASVGTEDEVANGSDADYWGVGPFRDTGSKADAGDPLGLEGARRILDLSQGIPGVAIGGVSPDDCGPLRNAGFAGVAVLSGILGAHDVEAAARRYAQTLR